MNTAMPYHDRVAAGQALGKQLLRYANRPDTVVLGLPRGGVPVGFEVSRAIHAPLDVFVVRKLGLPGHPELAMGAIAAGGARVLSEELVRSEGVSPKDLAEVIEREAAELTRRETLYRAGRPALRLEGRVVLVVDDGLATGSSLSVAISALKLCRPARLVVGVPVGAPDSCAKLAATVDELVCPLRPDPFYAVGCWYDHFSETSDDDVRRCLDEAAEPAGAFSRETGSAR